MVELKTCGSLVNAGALCGIETHELVKESNNNNVNIAEIFADLRREREKNEKLMERISMLEAQIKLRDSNQSFVTRHGQGSYIAATERSLQKFKRQKTGSCPKGTDEIVSVNDDTAPRMKQDTQCAFSKDANLENQLVNWMSKDEALLLQVDKLKDDDFVAGSDDTDDSDEEEENEETNTNEDIEKRESYENTNNLDKCQAGYAEGTALGSFFDEKGDRELRCTNGDCSADRNKYCRLPNTEPSCRINDLQICDKEGTGSAERNNKTADDHFKELASQGLGNVSYVKKPPKIAFCPKEVKRMLESEVLQLKNAQSHTIRKIIVFASLGIRHGCDEMYDLDFNHFSVLRKGEPYVSSKDPGEHVLYENPGVRRKIFYPNWQNPTLCPVQILEEEKAMRPSDPSCPSYLFLCIKYGGRTRNLPQNEYVRQRMGRNKLKSFGPLMCRMAMLVHIRSGSFFFKALGITLLFMAGFPDDLVQIETKYRSLDLLQKYYRTDEDAKGEELFLPQQFTFDTASPGSEKLSGKTTSTKLKGKKQPNSTSRPHSLPRSSVHHSVPSNSVPSNHLGLIGYASVQTHAMAALRSLPSSDNPLATNPENNCSDANFSNNNQTTYQILPPHPGNAFMPMLYWPAPNAFHPSSYASMYGYQSFPSTTSYSSLQPQHYYSYPSTGSTVPKMAERNGKNEMNMEESDSSSNCSSSSLDTKVGLASCK